MLENFDHLVSILSYQGYIPHGHCYLWQSGLVGLHVLADGLIAIAYYSIPITLFYFVRKRKDLPFRQIFILFAAFIVSCGTTHLLSVWTLWIPSYWVSGTVKAITALISIYTAMALVPLMPLALALPSPAKLEQANRQLEHEIAERSKVEIALRESEERFRKAFDYAATGMTLASPDGQWFQVNQQFTDIVGYSESELLSMKSQDITVSEDFEAYQTCVDQLLVGEIRSFQLEKRYVHKQGHHVWALLSTSLMRDEAEHPLYFIGQIQDITDRKHAEEELKQSQRFRQKIADTVPFILYVYDLTQNQIHYINQGVSSVLGYSVEQVKAWPLSMCKTLLHPQDSVRIQQQMQYWQSAADGDVMQSELRVKAATGDWRYLQCQETAFERDESGQVTQILGAAEDISDRKELEVQKALLKEKEVLLQEIHHRVKNNLQIVDSLLSLQGRQLEDPATVNILQASQNRIASIALVHEKLYRSPDLTNINFQDYLYGLLSHLCSFYQFELQAIQFDVNVESLPLSMDIAVPCGLIVNELITNALKYAFPKAQSGRVWVTVETLSSQQVSLVVGDNGVGFPADLDLETMRSLGLSLVNNLVEQLEGTLILNREVGTVFQITFPLNDALSQD